MISEKKICDRARILAEKGGRTYEEILTELGEYAVSEKLAKPGYPAALVKREQEFPTGLQAILGIAIPHSTQDYTLKSTLVIELLEEPVEFWAMGSDEKVQVEVVFMLLLNRLENQVKMLENIVMFIQDEEKMKSLKSDYALQVIEETFGAYI